MSQMPLVRPPTPPSSRDLVYDDGEPMESGRHVQQMVLLIQSLELAWADRTDFYAAGNMFLYYSETQSRRNDFRGPDFFVVLGTTRRERKSWVVWEEDGKAPDVIVELLSESTEHVDRNDKMRIYGRTLKVGEYFLFDPWTSVLEGYSLDAERGVYVPKTADANGRLRCNQVGYSLGVVTSVLHGIEVPWLRWIDDNGRTLPAPEEDVRNARADLERGKAELERGKAELERGKAELERAKAEAERANAELAALRAKLGDHKG